MDNFTYQNPTKIIFGRNEIASIREEIPKGAKILMTYGGGSIKKNGVYEQAMKALEGFDVIEFGGIEANPRYETVMRAVKIAREAKVTFLLAIGGGSVIDATKFLAAALPFQGEPWDILDKEKQAAIHEALPLGTILTLSATGTEMNGVSVITHAGKKIKCAFENLLVYPQFSVLDPEVTFSVPRKQISNGVVDAFVHVIEQYLTFPANGHLQDRFAESILITLIEIGATTLNNPKDYNARASFMWCATLALNGLISCGVPGDWATHLIGHQLTVLHGLDHAETLAVILPALMQYKRDKKHEKLLQYAERVWNITSGSEDERIDQAIQKTRLFFESLNVKTHLSGYGIKPSDIPALVQNLEKEGSTALGEHNDIHPEDAKNILLQCV
jgi:NADP-dependent alcohol dehydrogenase